MHEKFTYNNRIYEVELFDSGTLDTLIQITDYTKEKKHMHILNSEFRQYIKIINGFECEKELLEELKRIAITIIDTDNRYWDN